MQITRALGARFRTPVASSPRRVARITPQVRAFSKKNHEETGRDIQLNASVLPVAGLALAEAAREVLQPSADYLKSLDLPETLVQWGHPGGMLLVLLAMGGYSACLGWRIRAAEDKEAVARLRDLHPKVAMAMTAIFAAGALGGMTSLLVQDKPILESPHALTGLAGLGLLGIQAALPALFSSEDVRTLHAYLGTATLGLLAAHAVLGVQLGLGLGL